MSLESSQGAAIMDPPLIRCCSRCLTSASLHCVPHVCSLKRTASEMSATTFASSLVRQGWLVGASHQPCAIHVQVLRLAVYLRCCRWRPSGRGHRQPRAGVRCGRRGLVTCPEGTQGNPGTATYGCWTALATMGRAGRATVDHGVIHHTVARHASLPCAGLHLLRGLCPERQALRLGRC